MDRFHQQPLITDYRLHLPHYVRYADIVGSVAVTLGIVSRATTSGNRSIANSFIGAGMVVLVPSLVLRSFVQLFQTARNRLRDTIVKPVDWRGDEIVLDVGTGSGILLFACAKQLVSGKAIGIDIYDPNAGGGSKEIFWRNARAEGVADKVELRPVDVRQMPFADETFDVTVSSLAMHHVGGAEDRQRATEEIVRTLKSGGRVSICDVTAVIGDCEQALRQQGMTNIRKHEYLHLFTVLSADKP